jgi:hypothetical protein
MSWLLRGWRADGQKVGTEKKSKKILTEEIVYITLLALCGFRTAGLFCCLKEPNRSLTTE